jgi:hypothetical protein
MMGWAFRWEKRVRTFEYALKVVRAHILWLVSIIVFNQFVGTHVQQPNQSVLFSVWARGVRSHGMCRVGGRGQGRGRAAETFFSSVGVS